VCCDKSKSMEVGVWWGRGGGEGGGCGEQINQFKVYDRAAWKSGE